MRLAAVFIASVLPALAGDGPLKQATELYQRTQYAQSLHVLQAVESPDAAAYNLSGRDYLFLGDFKKATEALQKAVDREPDNSDHYLWLGRAWGRRAESASPFTAPVSASKARDAFERAVELDPNNLDAIGDLFDYYVAAPRFLGGGLDKAAVLAERIQRINPAEYQFAQAQLAEKRQEYHTAEQHFRRAIQLAPRQVGRVIYLARYLAKQGRIPESEAVFEQASRIAPDNPRVLFWRAQTYVQEKRNLEQAQILLKRYLQSNLTPDDPSREEAEKLLKRTLGA